MTVISDKEQLNKQELIKGIKKHKELFAVTAAMMKSWDKMPGYYTEKEAIAIIENGRNDQMKIKFTKDTDMTGINAKRYKRYSLYRTMDDIDAAIESGQMTMNELIRDVRLGHCEFVKERKIPKENKFDEDKEFDIHEINEHVANLTETIPAANPEIGVFERLYYLRSNERIVKEKTWKQNLIKTAHIACVMGLDSTQYKNAMDRLALLSVNEVICGKTTPLTLKEAKQLPEWEIWLESMKKEFKALKDMGTFELVKRSEVPRGHKIIKTKFSPKSNKIKMDQYKSTS